MDKKLILVTSPYSTHIDLGLDEIYGKLDSCQAIKIRLHADFLTISDYRKKAEEILKTFDANDRSFVIGFSDPLFLEAFNIAFMQYRHDKVIDFDHMSLHGYYYKGKDSNDVMAISKFGINFAEIKEQREQLAKELQMWKFKTHNS